MSLICKMTGGQEDVWHCTNIQLMDYPDDFKRLLFSGLFFVYNTNARDCWIRIWDNENVCTLAGRTMRL